MQRKYPDSDLNKAEVTIEFLRARLNSERSICRALHGKSVELERKRLEGEVVRRKKAELATKEIIFALQHSPPSHPKHHLTGQSQKQKQKQKQKVTNRNDQQRQTRPEESLCNCAIFSFPRPSSKSDEKRASGGSSNSRPPPPLPTSSSSFAVRTSKKSPSLQHGILQHEDSNMIIRNDGSEQTLRWQQSKSMELIQLRSPGPQQQEQQCSKSMELGKEQRQMWVASSNYEANLTPSPRRVGKSCRTIRRRDI